MKEDKSIMSALLLLLGFEINLSIDSKTPSGNKYNGKKCMHLRQKGCVCPIQNRVNRLNKYVSFNRNSQLYGPCDLALEMVSITEYNQLATRPSSHSWHSKRPLNFLFFFTMQKFLPKKTLQY